MVCFYCIFKKIIKKAKANIYLYLITELLYFFYISLTVVSYHL